MDNMKPYKGVEDLKGKDVKIFNTIIDIFRNESKKLGFLEYRTSILEEVDTFKGKTSDEIFQEQIYSFTDKGGRKVVLRPEVTPVLARLIKTLDRDFRKPQRLFSISNVFRYEQPQVGRKREHTQLNADIVGSSELWAEIEILRLIETIMNSLGVKIKIKINDRGYMNEYFKNIKNKKELFRLLDKKDKDEKEFKLEMSKKFPDVEIPLDAPNSVNEIKKLLPNINIEYSPTLVRGFDYYTGIVFEVFDVNADIKRSIAGGGRYDSLIKNKSELVPSVGVGIGDVVLRELVKKIDIEKSSVVIGDVIEKDVLKKLKSEKAWFYPKYKSIGETLKRLEKEYGGLSKLTVHYKKENKWIKKTI